MATTRKISGELDRVILYDVLSNIEKTQECSNINRESSYQAKKDLLPDVDRFIDRSPNDIVLEDPEVAISYTIRYENQEVIFSAYSDGEDVGIYVEEGNGKSTEFISDFRDTALEEPSNGELSGSKIAIRNLLSN